MDDTSLFALIQRNDQNAFGQLFNNYSSELCVLAFRYVKHDGIAQDIVQEFFIRLWKKRHTLRVDTSFRAYAYKAVYNASLNHLRGHKREEFHKNSFLSQDNNELEQAVPPLEDPAQELRALIREAIDSLPAECRKIFILVRFEEMKYADVAAQLGLSVNTIKVQMSKAYRILREKMDKTLPALILLLKYFS